MSVLRRKCDNCRKSDVCLYRALIEREEIRLNRNLSRDFSESVAPPISVQIKVTCDKYE